MIASSLIPSSIVTLIGLMSCPLILRPFLCIFIKLVLDAKGFKIRLLVFGQYLLVGSHVHHGRGRDVQQAWQLLVAVDQGGGAAGQNATASKKIA